MEQIVVSDPCDAQVTASGIWPLNSLQAEPEMSVRGPLADSAAILRTAASL
jgi:hypothetical protein